MIEGFVTDITLLKRSESALKRSSAYFEAIVGTVVDGIITFDEQGNIELFNKAAQKLFAYTADEVVGKSFFMLVPGLYSSEHDQYISRYLEADKARNMGAGWEVTAQRKNGSSVPVHLFIAEMDIRYY